MGLNLYWAIFLAVLSTLVLPVPEEVALLAAGYWTQQSQASPVLALLAAWGPVLIGDVLTYLAGAFLLVPLLSNRFVRRLIKPDLFAWAQHFVRTHRWLAVLIGRFLIQLRGPVYLALGAGGGSFWRFLAADAVVGAVEVGCVFFAGYYLGQSTSVLLNVRALYGVIVAMVALSIAIPTLVRRHLRRRSVGGSS